MYRSANLLGGSNASFKKLDKRKKTIKELKALVMTSTSYHSTPIVIMKSSLFKEKSHAMILTSRYKSVHEKSD